MSWGKEGSESCNENGCGIVPPATPSVSSGKMSWIYPLIWSSVDVGNPVESQYFPFFTPAATKYSGALI